MFFAFPPGVKCVHWLSFPSQICRFTPSLTRRPSLTSVLTAPSRSPMPRTWRSIYASTWGWSLITALTARNPSASSHTYSNTPGELNLHASFHLFSWQFSFVLLLLPKASALICLMDLIQTAYITMQIVISFLPSNTSKNTLKPLFLRLILKREH